MQVQSDEFSKWSCILLSCEEVQTLFEVLELTTLTSLESAILYLSRCLAERILRCHVTRSSAERSLHFNSILRSINSSNSECILCCHITDRQQTLQLQSAAPLMLGGVGVAALEARAAAHSRAGSSSSSSAGSSRKVHHSYLELVAAKGERNCRGLGKQTVNSTFTQYFL